MSDMTPGSDPLLTTLNDIRSRIRRMPDANDIGYMIAVSIAASISVAAVVWWVVSHV